MYSGLKGKVAIVTGGGRGIGKGCVKALAEQGCNVVVADLQHDDETKANVAQIAEETGAKLLCADGDVSKSETSNDLVKFALENFGRLDILVNNAGRGSIRKPVHELTDEDWRTVQEITLNSQFFMSRAVLKYWRENDVPGNIVNVLSKSAFTTNSVDNTTYISAKAGAYGLTRGSANEYAGYNIRINAVIPGYVQTERTYPDGEPRTEKMRALLPTKKFTTPYEIGEVVAFLASDDSSCVIGAAIDCSGGTML